MYAFIYVETAHSMETGNAIFIPIIVIIIALILIVDDTIEPRQ